MTARPDRAAAGRRARRLGRRGERAARRALRRAGYRILGRNVRTPEGEVDLLAREGTRLVLVEVKTTAGARPRGTETEALGRVQRARLARAGRWIGSHAREAVRRDLVVVRLQGWRALVHIHRGGA